MNIHRVDPVALPTIAALRTRCLELGLPVWTVSPTGELGPTPGDDVSLVGFLGSPTLRGLLEPIARGWSAVDEPVPVSPARGMYAIPIRAQPLASGGRGETLLALALSPSCVEEEWFEVVSMMGGLEVRSAQRLVEHLCRHRPEGIPALHRTLGWMIDDLARVCDDQVTISGFTRQLTEGFETIDALYCLGRSMNVLSRPREFFDNGVSRLHASMSFGWLAAYFAFEPDAAAVAGDRLLHSGPLPGDAGTIVAALRGMLANAPRSGAPMVTTSVPGLVSDSGQLVVLPIVRGERLVGAVLAGDKRGEDPIVSSYDTHLLEAAGGYFGAFLENAMLYARQQAMFMGTLSALTSAIDAKDRYTCGHSSRVAYLSSLIARAAGLGEDMADRLNICGLVHDVGKIGVPEAVLTKPGKLSDEEFALIKMHPEIGHRILRDIPMLSDVLPGVMHHHERWDGRGYPHGLKGEQIPLVARIVGLADTFDAMSSSRAYRPAMPREKVMAELVRSAGTQLDPTLVPMFVTLDFGAYDRMLSSAAPQQSTLDLTQGSPAPSLPIDSVAA
ncbi:MAG: HD-GYP domain-containing protein [Phycisphaerales bacterium]